MKQHSARRRIKFTAKELSLCLLTIYLSAAVYMFSIHLELASQSGDAYHDNIAAPMSKSKGDAMHKSLPSMTDQQFYDKYSKYNGHLPSLKQYERVVDPSCGEYPDYFDFFSLPKSQRSRFFEDKTIYDTFFKDKTTSSQRKFNGRMPLQSSALQQQQAPFGTYVELGAFDGSEESNTIFFDKCLGWDGLLIEAQSESYEKVLKNRPNAMKLSFSPTCTEDKTKEGKQQTASFYNYPLSNNGMKDLAKSYTGKDTVEVPCGPLTPVLIDLFGLNGTISFLSLDVEGAESLVLDTLDFTKLNIEVIMIEVQNSYCTNPRQCPQVHQVRRRMAEAHYALFGDLVEASDVYAKIGTYAWRRGISSNEDRYRNKWIQERMKLREQSNAMA